MEGRKEVVLGLKVIFLNMKFYYYNLNIGLSEMF
jgi:hypothetical protein